MNGSLMIGLSGNEGCVGRARGSGTENQKERQQCNVDLGGGSKEAVREVDGSELTREGGCRMAEGKQCRANWYSEGMM